VALVVSDLQASVRIYTERYGIGTWEIYEFNPDTVENMRARGEPIASSWRLAIARVGSVMWELIEPLDDRSTYAEFLAEHGEGVHHVGMACTAFDHTLAEFGEEGRVPLLSGRYRGIDFAYLSTDSGLGVVTEIFSAVPTGQEPAIPRTAESTARGDDYVPIENLARPVFLLPFLLLFLLDTDADSIREASGVDNEML
jgi:hypothetical protein